MWPEFPREEITVAAEGRKEVKKEGRARVEASRETSLVVRAGRGLLRTRARGS